MVRMWLGDIAAWLLKSLIVSTTNGLELKITSTSTSNVLSDSSSKLATFVFMRDESMFLADWICLSHTPPMWLANGGFLFHWIQSALFCNMNSRSFFWFTSFQHLASSLCSHPISSVVTSNCSYIATSTNKSSKCQYKKVCPYFWLFLYGWYDLLNMWRELQIVPMCFFFLWWAMNQKKSTPQWVNGRFSFSLLYGKSAIICSPTLPLSLLQVAHLKITLFTAELPYITHYPEDLISLRVMFLLLCTVFWWHRLINKSVTFPLFGTMIGWVTFSLRFDFSSFPTTLKFHSCQWMDSSCQLFHILF